MNGTLLFALGCAHRSCRNCQFDAQEAPTNPMMGQGMMGQGMMGYGMGGPGMMGYGMGDMAWVDPA